MRNIFIIHFNPLELYPPVQNLLNLIAGNPRSGKVYVITTKHNQEDLVIYQSPSSEINIIRLGKLTQDMPVLKRYLNFIFFYFGCLFYLVIKKPLRILYYETLSSYPVFLYKKLFNQRVQVLIHYHEYTSKAEQEKQGKMLKYFDRCEKYLYPVAAWVSHTNQYRMEAFEKDIYPVKIHAKKVLPNFPPGNWYSMGEGKIIQKPVKVIYVGALSLQTMFTKEFANWVVSKDGKVTWDIYSYNVDVEVQGFLKQLNTSFIQLRAGVNYSQLPLILNKYDVGVILYNGHIPNYVYNAPNKLFEYLACGLDVWFPSVMKGSLPYISSQVYPKVIPLDFSNLGEFNMEKAINREGYSPAQARFYSEDALAELNTQLFNLEK